MSKKKDSVQTSILNLFGAVSRESIQVTPKKDECLPSLVGSAINQGDALSPQKTIVIDEKEKVANESCLKIWKRDGRKYVHCTSCIRYPEIVKRLLANNKSPAIASEGGTMFRRETVDSHFATSYHKQCMKADRIKTLQVPSKETPIDLAISKSNEELANRIGKLVISVYNDAKRLTLSAHSWPSRVVSAEVASSFTFNVSAATSSTPLPINLQYVTPAAHLEFLECIVESDAQTIREKLESSLALSLRVDGSVDRTNIDKIYMLAKIVNSRGVQETIFLGIGDQTERGATGMLDAMKCGLNETFSEYEWIFKLISSLVTDGASVNTGEKKGLWRLIDDNSNALGSQVPILKIWCAAHRAELAWKDVSKSITEVANIFKSLVSISTYFHQSGLRTSELKTIAKDSALSLLSLPKMFEVRWSEFTFYLLNSMLTSWNALVLYFQRNVADKECNGFLKFLTKVDNIKLIAFLADILFIYMRFQKNLQADNLTLITMHSNVKSLLNSIARLQEGNDNMLPGGWEDAFCKALQIRSAVVDCETTCDKNKNFDDSVVGDATVRYYLKDIELWVPPPSRRKEHHRFVSDRRELAAIKNEIMCSLQEYLQKRFEIDEDILSILEPFVALNSSADISEIHSRIAPDTDLASLFLQYQELCEVHSLKLLSLPALVAHIATSSTQNNYCDILKVLARILAATPHSADVERCISANNLLKTSLRSTMNLTTENKYLYVHFNMPDLTDWIPRKAVLKWLKKKERRRNEVTSQLGKSKAVQQKYFKGVFPEAEGSGRREVQKSNAEIDDIQEIADDNNPGRDATTTKKLKVF